MNELVNYIKGRIRVAKAIEKRDKVMTELDKLFKYLKNNERSFSWLARKCEVSPTTVHYWAIGKNSPTNKHKVMIKEATGIKL